MDDAVKKMSWAEKYVKNIKGIDKEEVNNILDVVAKDIVREFKKNEIDKKVFFDGHGKSLTLPTYAIAWVFQKDTITFSKYNSINDQNSQGSITVNWTGCDFEVIDETENKEKIIFDCMSKELIDYVLDLLYKKRPLKITHEYFTERQDRNDLDIWSQWMNLKR